MTAQDTATPMAWAAPTPAPHVGADLVGAVFDRPDGTEMRVRRAEDAYPAEVVVGIDGQDQEWRADAAKVRALVERKREAVLQAPQASVTAPAAPTQAPAIADGAPADGGGPAAETGIEPPDSTMVAHVTPEQQLAAAHAAYQRLKTEQPGALAVLAVGETYEVHDADAQVVADALGTELTVARYPGGGYGFRAVFAPSDIDAQIAALTARGHRVLVAQVAPDGETVVCRTVEAATAQDATPPPDDARRAITAPEEIAVPLDAAPTTPDTPVAADSSADVGVATVVREDVRDQEAARAPTMAEHAAVVAADSAAAPGNTVAPAPGDTIAPAPGDTIAPAPGDTIAPATTVAGSATDGTAPGHAPDGTAAPPSPSVSAPPAVTRHKLLVSMWLDVGVSDDGWLSVAPEFRLSVGPRKNGDAAPADVLVSRAVLGPETSTGDLSGLGALVADLIRTRHARKAAAEAEAQAEKGRQTQKQKEEKKATAQKKKDDDKLGGLKAAAGRAATLVVAAPGAPAPPVPVPGATTPLAAQAQRPAPAPTADAVPAGSVPLANVQAAVAARARKDGGDVQETASHEAAAPPCGQMSLLDF